MLNYKRFDRIMKKHTPRGWRVVYSPANGQDCLGMADADVNVIHIPNRDSVEVLLLFLHECAHIKLKHHYMRRYVEWYEEYQAERWAYTTAIREGIVVSEYRLGVMKAYVRRRYRKHLSVCKLYGIPSRREATPGELKWMEL